MGARPAAPSARPQAAPGPSQPAQARPPQAQPAQAQPPQAQAAQAQDKPHTPARATVIDAEEQAEGVRIVPGSNNG